jgi:hypothetical protein
MLPLKSKIRLNVIPSPGFKLVVLVGFRDDSCAFLNVFLNGHNIKRVHLCSRLKIIKIKNHNIAWSAVSDLDHCQFKMPGKCKFLNKWLEQPQYHAWLRNSRAGENRPTWLEQKRTDGYCVCPNVRHENITLWSSRWRLKFIHSQNLFLCSVIYFSFNVPRFACSRSY